MGDRSIRNDRQKEGGGKRGGTHSPPSKLLGSGKAKQMLLPLDLCHQPSFSPPSDTVSLQVSCPVLIPPRKLSNGS
ncbi:hypothetical protein CEXT_361931 [Caerostris extrusa]|uniref:Uncharacterized protein n=1 Tax=Caerostris extrusa TaxID=172846 RepID=A0AAV4XWZ9_CAEEX|nr:hypothetical protein CEXT_361931 [Caerostris extrusa]